ncbi:PREDICTED: BEN domain-containing protein 2 [Nanorana parkeri]|uniref:BEN domain-containing protein 2 n=1 Tax=Nanorana parkeri TaxID=125878 RepID=UPI000854BB4A|nr:PREDICTED: BEN domain-containing protein 2 [Nanorana parkeri]
MQSDVNTTEKLHYGFPHKRRRVASMMSDNTVEIQEQEYEDTSVEFGYDAEYECASVKSDISYSGDHQPSLTDVLYYCQAMYDIVQKLDKKMDLLQRKVSELHHAQMKSHLKPRPINLSQRGPHAIPQAKLRLQKLNQSFLSSKFAQRPPSIPNNKGQMEDENRQLPGSPAFKSVHSVAVPREPQQTQRLSPPLPTIVSTRSLHPVISVTTNEHRDIKIESLPESTCASPPIITTPPATSSVCSKAAKENIYETEPVLVPHVNLQRNIISNEELPSSSVQLVPIYEFLGDPSRNIKVPGSFLVKARQKTQPKYAARYLVRALFPKDILLSSATGGKVQGLDVNKVSAIREFLASIFPECDLSEYGKDWKTCTTNVNAMIRCLHLETKKNAVNMFPNQAVSQAPEDSICLDSDDAVEEDHEAVTENNKKDAQNPSFLQANILNKQKDNRFPGPPGIGTPVKHHSSDPIECFGEPWRNVQLPFSVIYIGKGKPRPELSARYLIRHLFPEDVLVKSNVYGNLERGVLPLDSNRIGALRDFLQMNYPTFDLKECGHDWKACVAAINSTIRSLRHDQKKATFHTRKITSLGS